MRWDGEKGQELLARLAIVNGTPTVRELAVRKKGGEWATLGRDLVPEFCVTTGVRRTGHGLTIRKPLGRFLGRTAEPSRRRFADSKPPIMPTAVRSGRTGLGWKSRFQG